MKKKYTLTIANAEINIITEESKETIDSIVGIVDRKIREVYLHSKGECSRTNAAILVCLDYCAEKMELQKTLKNLNGEVEHLTRLNEVAEREKAALEREIELLRESIAAANTVQKANAKKTAEDQIGFDEMDKAEEAEATPVETVVAPVAEEKAEETVPEAVEEAPEAVVEEAPAAPEATKPSVKLKKKKVRAMFDMISFDEI
jgi:cell division protein ZapA (FtsZ GTPase activity inhibitor)